jgi:hypothetical protein
MMTDRYRSMMSGICTALLLFVVAVCAALASACSDSEVKQCAKAAAGVSTSLSVFEQSVETVQQQQLITVDEAIGFEGMIADATRVNDQFVAQVRSAKQLNGPTVALLTVGFQNVAASIDRLEAYGVLHIKNPDAQARLSESLKAVQIALTVVQSFTSLKNPAGTTVQPQPGVVRTAWTKLRNGAAPPIANKKGERVDAFLVSFGAVAERTEVWRIAYI